jgi:putative ABC transport system permease protein
MVTGSALRTKLRRDLRRRRSQFAAIALTLFLGIALFGASYDAFLNLQASYAAMYGDTRFADLTITGGPLDRIAADARA